MMRSNGLLRMAVAACWIAVVAGCQGAADKSAMGVQKAEGAESDEEAPSFGAASELAIEEMSDLRADSEEPSAEAPKPLAAKKSEERHRGGRGSGSRRAAPAARAAGNVTPSRPSKGKAIEELLVSADELWILEKREWTPRANDEDDRPGTGSLVARVDGIERDVAVPLKHTAVKARVSGYIASVDVTQQFHNPYDTKIEASYVFPLPQNAAVTDFVMTVGDRKIRGIIREREEAKRIYQAARNAGKVASLLTQERPNIFSQKVANIEPGKNIDITISYFNTLNYTRGAYEFVFPMVVGPRYNPPDSTDPIVAAPRNSEPREGTTTVNYLRPGERSGHDIALELSVEAGVAIESIDSVHHVIDKTRSSPSAFGAKLGVNDRIPNKDFVLRYRVAGDRIKSNLITHEDERGGFFSLMVYPPAELEQVQRQAVEFVFVLDCSGSMRGEPLNAAKRAAARALRGLRSADTFQIIRFSSNASALGTQPLPATPENVQRGLTYLESLNSTGGTQMIEGIKAALDFPHDESRFRLVSFMTDGFIGNEDQIFRAIHEKLGTARIFSFGIGNNINRHLLEGLARIGKGAVAYVSLDEGVAEVVDQFYERVRHPALTDLRVNWDGLEVSEVFPKTLPDLFVGRPAIIVGRYKKGQKPKGTIRIEGRAGPLDQAITVPFDFSNPQQHEGIASVWARKQIEVLSDHATRQPDSKELPEEIERLALEFNLISNYTAFVAVDSASQTSGEHGVTVPVPVPVPDGVEYSTTVGK